MEYKETLQGERSYSSLLQLDRIGNIMLRVSLCLIIEGGGGKGTWKVN